jgi:hypothetical protein
LGGLGNAPFFGHNPKVIKVFVIERGAHAQYFQE